MAFFGAPIESKMKIILYGVDDYMQFYFTKDVSGINNNLN